MSSPGKIEKLFGNVFGLLPQLPACNHKIYNDINLNSFLKIFF